MPFIFVFESEISCNYFGMNSNSRISFIIPAFNCQETLVQSFQSILNGNFEIGDEIIIIDDASTDNTFEIATKMIKDYSFVKILRHRYNKGSAAAGRNSGIEYSSNELIFCLDADNLLMPASISLLKDFLLKQKVDAVAFGEIRYFVDTPDNVVNVWTMYEDITFLDAINFPEFGPCSSGNYLFTKSSWLKAGRYNEGIGGAFDSWAFGIAQLAAGCKIKCLKDTFYLHRQGYESTYIREIKKANPSLTVTRILIPYFKYLSARDIEYILNPYHRSAWYKKINERPLKGETFRESYFKVKIRTLLFRLARFLS